MIVNPEKFKVILLDKRNSDLYLNKNITTDIEHNKILAVHVDSKSNFSLQIDIIGESASN